MYILKEWILETAPEEFLNIFGKTIWEISDSYSASIGLLSDTLNYFFLGKISRASFETLKILSEFSAFLRNWKSCSNISSPLKSEILIFYLKPLSHLNSLLLATREFANGNYIFSNTPVKLSCTISCKLCRNLISRPSILAYALFYDDRAHASHHRSSKQMLRSSATAK